MTFAIGDRVQLTEECGASIGTIFHWTGGPGPLGEYHLTPDWPDKLEGASSAGPGQIAALIEPAPPAAAYEIGQSVILGTRLGVVVALPGGDLVDVEILVELTRWRGKPYLGRAAYLRTHRCPAWQLKLENRSGT